MKNIIIAEYYKFIHKRNIVYYTNIIGILLLSIEVIIGNFFEDKFLFLLDIILNNLDRLLIFSMLLCTILYEPFKYNTRKNNLILKISKKKTLICGIISQISILLIIILYFFSVFIIGLIFSRYDIKEIYSFIQILILKLLIFIPISLVLISIGNCVLLIFKSELALLVSYILIYNFNILINILEKIFFLNLNSIKEITINTQIYLLNLNLISFYTILRCFNICLITFIIFNVFNYYLYVRD